MASVSVAQAAQRLGVSVTRVHQRIADGSLAAERVGSQWVVDERSLLRVRERSKAGRPLSPRSAWAVIAASEDDRDRLKEAGSVASRRARVHLDRLLAPHLGRPDDEKSVGELAVSLRSVFRNRAERRLLRAAPADLAELRADSRWAFVVDLGASGIASGDVEGYLEVPKVEVVAKDYLLMGADRGANVVLHVIPDGQYPFPNSRLRLAADLAEHRGPREEARAAELVHALAVEWKGAKS